ncbi:CAP domain-containing protein [Dimargaris cristalligena]|uniref:CAP domain-containing protein n=1 Tax=Dimargaris cristalligena TaxID=215637 RepID=A0A4V1J5H6_9FUNG|nr:CAP domain-containing protein [Dimargaris cristalligena]|eukprot:RKP39089.1 CAP domain-containing protein [Dimargaris cristalligena]
MKSALVISMLAIIAIAKGSPSGQVIRSQGVTPNPIAINSLPNDSNGPVGQASATTERQLRRNAGGLLAQNLLEPRRKLEPRAQPVKTLYYQSSPTKDESTNAARPDIPGGQVVTVTRTITLTTTVGMPDTTPEPATVTENNHTAPTNVLIKKPKTTTTKKQPTSTKNDTEPTTTPAPSDPNTSGGSEPKDARLILDKLNELRRSLGLQPAVMDATLNALAVKHSNYQNSIHTMTHNDSAGSLGARLSKAGVKWNFCAENVAYGYVTAAEAMNGWTKSEGHYLNMINPKSVRMGWISSTVSS